MNKNKGKKSLTAVGAAVTAGLAPGIVASYPSTQAPRLEVEVTAADVVAIGGEVLDFDELFAATQHAEPDTQAVAQEAQRKRERARRDSVRRAQERRVAPLYGSPQLVYGPPPVVYHETEQSQREATALAADIDAVTHDIIALCAKRIDATYNGIAITPDSNLISDLGMDSINVVQFVTEVESLYQVELPDNFLADPPTPRRLASQVIKAKAKAKR